MMNISVGKILSSARDSAARLLITVLVNGIVNRGQGDVRSPLLVAPPGIDSNPIPGKRAIYIRSGVNGKYYVVGTINTNGRADVGEIRLFSTDEDDNEQMWIHLKKDGTAEFGGDQDFMVRFNKLEDGFMELREDHNDLALKHNAHVHPTTTPGAPTGVTTMTQAASTASIADAKIEEIKTSG